MVRKIYEHCHLVGKGTKKLNKPVEWSSVWSPCTFIPRLGLEMVQPDKGGVGGTDRPPPIFRR